ncbi:hypothetical protein [Paenibacillus elgii]|uniref:hypothetical protein n=1 Tax=Paenibacillus elgii TaxID=189691 RepID=UPI00203C9F9E|nr:hypothetical protein [Paenibacillus elgii]MCM3270873.1 hypothetical protein [Paenibacillus elgii]
MKKIFLFVLLFIAFTGQVFANEKETGVTETIDYIYYDLASGVYMADTVPDESGEGFWSIEIDNEEGESIEALNKRYKGKKVEIVFIGNVDTNNEIKIVSSEILD